MKKIALFVFLLLNYSGFGQNQKLSTTLLQAIPLQADTFIGTDNFGYFYYIKDRVFFKQKDTQIWEYKNINLGNITVVDIQNSLNLVLFYESFNTVIMLDNQLAETYKINFNENTTPINVKAAGIASQNQLWVYNALNQQIGLYNYLNDTYNPFPIPITENILYYQSDINQFHWIDTSHNWYTIDNYGKRTLRGKIPDFDSILFLSNNRFIICKNNFLTFEDTAKKIKFDIEILEKSIEKFCYKDRILTIFTQKGITNYKIIIP